MDINKDTQYIDRKKDIKRYKRYKKDTKNAKIQKEEMRGFDFKVYPVCV